MGRPQKFTKMLPSLVRMVRRFWPQVRKQRALLAGSFAALFVIGILAMAMAPGPSVVGQPPPSSSASLPLPSSVAPIPSASAGPAPPMGLGGLVGGVGGLPGVLGHGGGAVGFAAGATHVLSRGKAMAARLPDGKVLEVLYGTGGVTLATMTPSAF